MKVTFTFSETELKEMATNYLKNIWCYGVEEKEVSDINVDPDTKTLIIVVNEKEV